jgi:hypothetical protein
MAGSRTACASDAERTADHGEGALHDHQIGINGFGRIGRDDLQVGAAGDPEEVAADDLTDPRTRSRWTAGGSG